MKKKIKIVVTGGAGFIGSHLTDLLVKKDFNVIVLDDLSTGSLKYLKNSKKKINFNKIDISKRGNWYKLFKGAQVVIHLAAKADIVPSIINPESYYETNVNGTYNVIKYALKAKVKTFIYAASSSCYGLANQLPTAETAKIDLRYPYALTKNLGEKIIEHFSKVYNFNAVSLRLFNVYGTRSRTSGAYGAVFGVFLAQKYHRKPLTVVGNGEQSRDFVHVKDVANAFFKAIKFAKKFQIFNIGCNRPIKINKIANIIGGKKIYIPKRPGEPEKTHANINKAIKFLKWKPKIKIEEGTKEILKNIKMWKDAPVWTPSKIKESTKEWFKRIK